MKKFGLELVRMFRDFEEDEAGEQKSIVFCIPFALFSKNLVC